MIQSRKSPFRKKVIKSTYNKVIQHIIDHIINVYGFRIISERIPQNEFEKLKMKFYSLLKNKKLNNFFDRNFPVKFVPNLSFDVFSTATGYTGKRSIWFRKVIKSPYDDGGYENGDVIEYFEIEIRSVPPESTIHMSCSKKIFTSKPDNNFSVNIYYSKANQFLKFPINYESGIQSIDAYFTDYPCLKQCIRDYKLKNIGI